MRCGRGAIWDVVVDLRRGSPTYGRWEGFELSDENMHVLYVPAGFGHGFCVLSEVADVLYKQSAYYDPAVERGIAWDDPQVARASGRCRRRRSWSPSATRRRRGWPTSPATCRPGRTTR